MTAIDKKRELSREFARKANWYVLFVKTYEEDRVVEMLKKVIENENFLAFVPKRDYSFKLKSGEFITRHNVTWLKSYVFLVSELGFKELFKILNWIVRERSDIFKFLRNGESFEGIQLSQHDKKVMTGVLDENFNIPELEAVIEDDRVKIVGKVLEDMEGKVVKVDRRKGTAIVEMMFLNRLTNFEFALEFVEKM